jgi:S-formylglutathione hydrolase FrmB
LRRDDDVPAVKTHSCGVSDRWITANRALHASAEALHLAHAYDEAPYGHDWAYWQRIVPEHVAWHAERLATAK